MSEFKRRRFFRWVFLVLGIGAMAVSSKGYAQSQPLLPSQAIHTIAFGSCNLQVKPQSHWAKILRQNPQLWIWGGDAIYADHLIPRLRSWQYSWVKNSDGYRKMANKIPVLGTWDDHEYAYNNAGGEFADKKTSQQLYLDFLNEPKNSPRRGQAGIYWSYLLGAAPRQVKVILLDLRYFRQKPGPEQTLLGVTQWRWLEAELADPRPVVTLVMSSSQAVSEYTLKDNWTQYPQEQSHLFHLIDRAPSSVVILSGDRHYGEISKRVLPSGKLLYDITSSGLTHFEPHANANANRVGHPMEMKNFGLLNLDWKEKIVELSLELHAVESDHVFSQKIEFPY